MNSHPRPPPPGEKSPRPPPSSVAEARARVRSTFDGLRGAVVTLSGGVDSAVVLALAAEHLGAERCLAVTSRSESLAPHDLEDARASARRAGVEHVVYAGTELDVEGFRRNGPDRCFHCKDSIYGAARRLATERGLDGVLDGTNADDPADHRPGLAAAVAHGVRSPLLEAGLAKVWVRALATELGLPLADKPPESCLSSRFPYGTAITREGLERVRRAEDVVRAEGVRRVRVRIHDPVARIEVDPADFPRLLDPAARARIGRGLRALGFTWVSLDLDGFRAGAMNEALRPVASLGEGTPSG